MRIVLATPPAEGKAWSIIPPIGLTYVAGSVKNMQDVELRIVDAMSEELTAEGATERILDLSPDLVGVSLMSQTIQRGLKLITNIKKSRPAVLTLAGGYHSTAFDNLLLGEIPYLDMVLRGEVEEDFPQLCRRLLRNEDTAGVPGLSYRANGRIVRGRPQYMPDLDTIPIPDIGALEFEGYWQNFAGTLLPEFPRIGTIISSRGCPHGCTFCSKLTTGSRKYRTRSAENVFHEVLDLVKGGYETIFFADENFTHDVNRVRTICEMILAHDLNVRFMFQGTLHNLSQQALDLMHRAGFDISLVGVESGSDAQLKRYNKAGNSKAIAAGIKRAKKAHMFVHAYFMSGGPGETEVDCRASEEFVRNVRPHSYSMSEVLVFPGSTMWEELVGPVSSVVSIEDSRCRNISSITGQLSEDIIDVRIRDFRKAFTKSWLTWRRFPELIDLFRFNPTYRSLWTKLLKMPRGRLKAIVASFINEMFRTRYRKRLPERSVN